MKSILCARVSIKEKIDKSLTVSRLAKISVLLLMASILFFPSLVSAEIEGAYVVPDESDDFSAMYISQGMLSGVQWIKLSYPEKRAYLLGYEDGFIANAIFYLKDQKQRDEALSSLPTATTADLTMESLISGMDKLYEDSRNIKIPVPYAMIIMRNKSIGTEQKEIDAYIEYLRSELKKAGERKE